MLAEERAVVAHEHQHRVLEQRLLFQRRTQSTDSFIDSEHHLGPRLDRRIGDLLVEDFCTELLRDAAGVLRFQRCGEHRLAGTVLRGETEVGSAPIDLARVLAAVPFGGDEALVAGDVYRAVVTLHDLRMNGLVADVDHERLAPRSRRKLDRAIREQVGDVTGNALQAAVLEQLRIAMSPCPAKLTQWS